jgi:hypothetical protein
MRSKKGAIVSGLTTVLLYFGFVLLIIIFFFIFKFSKGEIEEKIASYAGNADMNTMLLGYLRSPVAVNGGKTNIAQLIALYETETDSKKKEEYFKKITQATEGTLNPLEYCYDETYLGIKRKYIVGYGVFILSEEDYRDKMKSFIYKNPRNTNTKKFSSEHFEYNRLKSGEPVFAVVPSPAGNAIYIGFYKVANDLSTLKKEAEGVEGCS